MPCAGHNGPAHQLMHSSLCLSSELGDGGLANNPRAAPAMTHICSLKRCVWHVVAVVALLATRAAQANLPPSAARTPSSSGQGPNGASARI